MTAPTLPLPDVFPAPADDEPNVVHLVCEIHPDWAVCGLHVPDDEYQMMFDIDGADCPLCVLALYEGRRCGQQPGCRGYQ